MTPLAKKVAELFGKPETVVEKQEIERKPVHISPSPEPTKPYLTDNGELRIPLTADPRYHWWKGGQSLAETLQKLNAPAEVWRRYIENYTGSRTTREN